jgi:hypothetical protein
MPRLETVLAALAAQCQAISGIPTMYPMKPAVVTNLKLGILAGALSLSKTGSEQRWLVRGRGLLLVPNTGEFDKHAARADAALAPIADAFDASGGDNVRFQLGGLVDRCAFAEANLYQEIRFAGAEYVGHELFWDIKFHRFRDQE